MLNIGFTPPVPRHLLITATDEEEDSPESESPKNGPAQKVEARPQPEKGKLKDIIQDRRVSSLVRDSKETSQNSSAPLIVDSPHLREKENSTGEIYTNPNTPSKHKGHLKSASEIPLSQRRVKNLSASGNEFFDSKATSTNSRLSEISIRSVKHERLNAIPSSGEVSSHLQDSFESLQTWKDNCKTVCNDLFSKINLRPHRSSRSLVQTITKEKQKELKKLIETSTKLRVYNVFKTLSDCIAHELLKNGYCLDYPRRNEIIISKKMKILLELLRHLKCEISNPSFLQYLEACVLRWKGNSDEAMAKLSVMREFKVPDIENLNKELCINLVNKFQEALTVNGYSAPDQSNKGEARDLMYWILMQKKDQKGNTKSKKAEYNKLLDELYGETTTPRRSTNKEPLKSAPLATRKQIQSRVEEQIIALPKKQQGIPHYTEKDLQSESFKKVEDYYKHLVQMNEYPSYIDFNNQDLITENAVLGQQTSEQINLSHIVMFYKIKAEKKVQLNIMDDWLYAPSITIDRFLSDINKNKCPPLCFYKELRCQHNVENIYGEYFFIKKLGKLEKLMLAKEPVQANSTRRQRIQKLIQMKKPQLLKIKDQLIDLKFALLQKLHKYDTSLTEKFLQDLQEFLPMITKESVAVTKAKITSIRNKLNESLALFTAEQKRKDEESESRFEKRRKTVTDEIQEYNIKKFIQMIDEIDNKLHKNESKQKIDAAVASGEKEVFEKVDLNNSAEPTASATPRSGVMSSSKIFVATIPSMTEIYTQQRAIDYEVRQKGLQLVQRFIAKLEADKSIQDSTSQIKAEIQLVENLLEEIKCPTIQDGTISRSNSHLQDYLKKQAKLEEQLETLFNEWFSASAGL